jgi:hypothetical protein
LAQQYKDAADYYVNEVIGLHTATDKNIDGAETALSLLLHCEPSSSQK